MKAAPESRLDTLDLLRGVAALAVVSLHYASMLGAPALLPHAYLAVDLFFALSGFVIAHAYRQRLLNGLPLRSFLLARLIRLYPLYAFATLAGWLVVLGSQAAGAYSSRTPIGSTVSLVANLLFLPALPGEDGLQSNLFPVLFPAWSLFWELAANLLYGLIIRRLSVRSLALILMVGFVLLTLTAVSQGALSGGARWSNLLAGPCRILWSYFAGVAVHGLYVRNGKARNWSPWLLAFVVLAVFAVPATGWVYDVSVAAVLPLVVLVGAQVRMQMAIGRFLGYISYAAYVFHAVVIHVTGRLTELIGGSPVSLEAKMLLLCPCLTSIILLSAYLTRSFDVPTRSWLTRTLVRKDQVVLA